ncbi:hypothetical protein QVG61_11425 [Thiohalobacter sp. IOR34]|uniref:hypothetical protein n=1 Tax=Thiohalobacter sp. IOR34 TaxID=3057176 RepID=UPI0025B1C1FC|nr:hypothetical protein [Thiohalobacter sp. IOR34]WJW75094.1 hypothetical protein QVG61_11425 [Thiohalobacter sp. IOR34]
MNSKSLARIAACIALSSTTLVTHAESREGTITDVYPPDRIIEIDHSELLASPSLRIHGTSRSRIDYLKRGYRVTFETTPDGLIGEIWIKSTHTTGTMPSDSDDNEQDE